jgi:hypothetical protein
MSGIVCVYRMCMSGPYACVGCRRPLLEGHHLVLGVWTSVLFTAAVTNIIKCPVGRMRPDFNARYGACVVRLKLGQEIFCVQARCCHPLSPTCLLLGPGVGRTARLCGPRRTTWEDTRCAQGQRAAWQRGARASQAVRNRNPDTAEQGTA